MELMSKMQANSDILCSLDYVYGMFGLFRFHPHCILNGSR